MVAERYGRLDFRDPHSWKLIKSVPIPWPGIDHLDFSANGHYLIASTEYSGRVVKVDTQSMRLTGALDAGGQPVDVKLAPDGSVFYVANQGRGGVSVIDPKKMKEVAFLPTGAGAHGLAISRDARSLYVSNRIAGTISVIDLARQKVTRTWQIGGSPDMLQVSPDGRQLWASGRYDSSVYVVDTRTGRLLHSIQVGTAAARPRLLSPARALQHRPQRRLSVAGHPRTNSLTGCLQHVHPFIGVSPAFHRRFTRLHDAGGNTPSTPRKET